MLVMWPLAPGKQAALEPERRRQIKQSTVHISVMPHSCNDMSISIVKLLSAC